ncbi:NAD(P)/FAD-dependent oxidoreductase [uncultured Desulfobacter sp.]|uniref:phytoene desaturase family protein n=1 Tax=uncultured Desulfobacter sp. TaxID=240139 RepID=UPI002AAA9CBA|nr:NAD(P)/FAD-dependent oxidoreductase [uncultured Desulfobacter sp.]
MAAERFDTIIVGSGISGMTAGIILAGKGQRVLIIEQHAVPGGLTQTFRREGLVFPTGVHRLGALNEKEPLWYFFNYLGLTDYLDLVPMARDGFEIYYFPDCTVKVPQNHDQYKDKMKSMFPDNAPAIDRYFQDMAASIRHLALYNPGCEPGPDTSSRYLGALDDYFENIGIKGRLKSILSANNILFGLPSSQCPLLTHFLITDAYLKSSFRINEQSTLFSQALSSRFTALGGKIKTRAKMTRLMITDRAVQGVELEGGQILEAPQVIYTGHPSRLPQYCPPKTFRPFYEDRLATAQNTLGIFGVCLAWNQTHCPVTDSDAYIFNSWDVNAAYGIVEEELQNLPDVIFLSALPGPGTQLAVTALIPLKERTRHKHFREGSGQKGQTVYKKNKAILAEQVMERLEQVFPGTRENARIVDTYSPATFERYTLTPEGSAYGIKKTAQEYLSTSFSPATRVKGLFLTGQSIGFCGIHGGISTSTGLCRGFFQEGELMKNIVNQGLKKQ